MEKKKELQKNLFSIADPLEWIIKHTSNYHVWSNLIQKSLYTRHDIRCEVGVDVGVDLQVFPKLCYYAKGYAAIDQTIYHYNKCNENSYGSRKKNIDWFVQLVKSYNTFYGFIEELGIDDFTESLRQSKMDHLFRYMKLAVKEKSKDGFQLLKSELLKHEAHYPQYKYWDNKHILKKNYSVFCFVLKHL